MAGIQLDVVVDDNGTVEIKGLEKALKGAGDEATKTGKKGKKGLDKMKKAAKKVQGAVGQITSKLVLMGAAAAAAAVGGLAVMVKMGLDMNSTLENSQVAFKVLVGDATRAANIMRELKDFSATTPFQIAEIAQAAKLMETFGIGGKKNLTIVGDAAATAQVPIFELAATLGKIASGAGVGEAFNRLGELGLVTRKELEGEGLVFDRGGSFQGTAEEAFDTVVRVMDRKFAGMMDQMSQTWSGKISTMKDNFLLTAGEMALGLFNALKPKLDRLTGIFQDWRDSGIAKAIGVEIAKWISKGADKLLDFLEDLPRVVQWIMAIGKGFKVVWDAIGNGFAWARNIVDAFAIYVGAKIAQLQVAMAIKMETLFGGEPGKALKWGKSLADNFAAGAEAGLVAAFQAPGMRDAVFTGFDDIREFLSKPLDFTIAPEGAAGGPGLDIDQEKISAEQALVDELAAINAEFRAGQSLLWEGYTSNLGQLAQTGFSDFLAAEIIESGTEIKMVLDGLWKGIRDSFIRMTVDMAVSWALMKAKEIIATNAARTAAGASLASAVPIQAGLNTALTSSFASTAAAKYFAAYAAIPFIGTGLAQAATATMMASIGATKAASLAFRTGGLVPGGGSGNGDERTINVSGREYIQPASAVSQYGENFMDSVRRGTYDPTGGSSLNLTLVGSAQDIDTGEVEELLVPVLEKLNRQSRFRVTANN